MANYEERDKKQETRIKNQDENSKINDFESSLVYNWFFVLKNEM